MTCSEYQDLLLDYAGLSAESRSAADAHLAECGACREFSRALQALDVRLAAFHPPLSAPAGLRAAVLGRAQLEAPPRRLSRLPELLDFAGWSGIAAAAVGVALALFELPQPDWLLLTSASVLTPPAIWAGLRSWRELER